MAWFISSERHFLNRFEPHGSGFAYRATFRSPAVYVTPAERDWLIENHNRINDMKIMVLFSAFMCALLISFVAAFLTNFQPWTKSIFLPTLLIIIILCAIWSESGRRRLLRGRPHLDKGLPKAEATHREQADKSWSRIIYSGSMAVLWIYISFKNDNDMGQVERILFLISSAAALAFIVWEMIGKFRQAWRSRQMTSRLDDGSI